MQITDKVLRINNIEFVKLGSTPVSSYMHEPRHSDCFVFVLSGFGDYTFEGEKYRAEVNDVIYLSRGSRYYVNIECDNFTYIYVDFYFEDSSDGIYANRIYKSARLTELASLFAELQKKYIGGTTAQRAESMAILYTIYSGIIGVNNTDYLPSGTRALLDPVIKEINERYSEGELSVKHLAELVGISEMHFRRLFARVYGTSPKKYIISKRLTAARELLSSTDMKISEIAVAVGFESAYYFSKSMREHTGMTPSEMRKRMTIT